MPHPTVYLTDDELEWVEDDGNRSGKIRGTIAYARENESDFDEFYAEWSQ